MEIKATLGNVDYYNIIKNAKSILEKKKDKKAIKLALGILDMPGDLALKAINKIPQSTKDEIVAYIINHQKDAVIKAITHSLEKKGFPVEISDPEVVAK